MTRRLYLAGPDVFRPDARSIAQRKKALCTHYGFEGLDPSDSPLPCLSSQQNVAIAIYRANTASMARADGIVANLTPFRGPSADPGTVFELAWMLARQRPAFAYSNIALPYRDRTLAALGGPDPAGPDRNGDQIEDFGLHDNLMIDCALLEAGQILVVPPCQGLDPLWGFEHCLENAARHFGFSR